MGIDESKIEEETNVSTSQKSIQEALEEEEEKIHQDELKEVEVVHFADEMAEGEWENDNFTFIQLLDGEYCKGEKVFTSWEPGKMDQFYILTKKKFMKGAELFIDHWLDVLLQKYGKEWCSRVFGMEKKMNMLGERRKSILRQQC